MRVPHRLTGNISHVVIHAESADLFTRIKVCKQQQLWDPSSFVAQKWDEIR